MAKISYDDIVRKDLLDLLELQDLPQDQKEQIYLKLYEVVENRTLVRISSILGDDKTVEWKKVLEMGDRTKVNDFLAKAQVDVQKILIEETALIKAQLVFLLEGSQAVTDDQDQAAPANLSATAKAA